MLGPILQERRDAMADTIARPPIDRRQFLDTLAGLAVRDLEARRQVAALLVGGHRQERTTGVRGDGGRERCRDGRAVHNLGHWFPLLPTRWRHRTIVIPHLPYSNAACSEAREQGLGKIAERCRRSTAQARRPPD